MENIIVIAIVVVIVAAACVYIYRAKKSGKKCVGCPDGGSCSSGCSSCQCGCGTDQPEK